MNDTPNHILKTNFEMLKSKYYAHLTKSLEHLKSLSAKKNNRKVARSQIRKALKAILDNTPSIKSKADDKPLHKLRISVKKLRYIC